MTRWRDLRAHAAVQAGDHEARFMVEEVSGYVGAEWLEIADTDAPERAEARIASMLERRSQGEPLQYVLGSWAFRSLDLMVDRRVLIPRPETEWVVEIALDEAERVGLRRGPTRGRFTTPTARIADLGTGSGAIALALAAELQEVEVWATDVSADALDVARANIAGSGSTRVRVSEGSWFAALPDELRGQLPLVVSNPPYIAEHELDELPPEVVDHEPRHALIAGPTGLEAIEHIVAAAPRWMAERATLVCEIAPHQGAAATALASDHGFDEVVVRADLTGRPRVLVARRAVGST